MACQGKAERIAQNNREAGRQADDGLDHQLDLVSFVCHTIIIHTWMIVNSIRGVLVCMHISMCMCVCVCMHACICSKHTQSLFIYLFICSWWSAWTGWPFGVSFFNLLFFLVLVYYSTGGRISSCLDGRLKLVQWAPLIPSQFHILKKKYIFIGLGLNYSRLYMVVRTQFWISSWGIP